MTARTQRTNLVFLVLLVLVVCSVGPAAAQSPYGGYYEPYEDPESSGNSQGGTTQPPTPTPIPPTPTPTPTPTPYPSGSLSLSVSPESAIVEPDGSLTFVVSMTALGYLPGQYTLSAMTLDEGAGLLSPSRTSLAGSGTWQVRLQAGAEPGPYPLYFSALDVLGNHSSASTILWFEIGGDPLLVSAKGSNIPSVRDTAEIRLQHKSWMGQIKFRNLINPHWFEYLAEDLYQSRSWQQTISRATRIDRDRLNITKTMAPIEEYKSYTDIQPIMSKYWADGGITVNIMTMNQLGNLSKTWKASPHLVVDTVPGIGSTLRLKAPTKGISAGNVLNGVGAAMILLDFWSNMSAAQTPTESREAWFTAGYASLDLYLATIVGNTFGSVVALPGMMVSYVLTNSYTTLIGGHKNCWFKKMIDQADFDDFLSDDIHDTVAVNKVKAAMLSQQGLEKTLKKWWKNTGPNWDGWMGSCGNWNLTEARDYDDIFVDRLMRTAEVEVNGKKYHPWAFYYSVSQMLVRERRREIAREAAEDARKIEAAYLSTLAQTTYTGRFRAVSLSNPEIPIKGATVFPTDLRGGEKWRTNEEGWFTASIKGHGFSPEGNVLMTIRIGEKDHLFVLPRSEFEEETS